MKLTEERIKDITAIQQRLAAKISSHQKEISMLEKNMAILDEILREGSFTKASDMLGEYDVRTADAEVGGTRDAEAAGPAPVQPARPQGAADVSEGVIRPIRRGGGGSGETIANAHIVEDRIIITMADGATDLREDIPPFRSFFVGKILDGMRRKDQEDAESGAIQKDAVISYEVETDDEANIKRIIIKNYRDERRATELVSTAGWSFARMLEKKGG